MSGKFALVIGNTEHVDPGLAKLTAPGRDTDDFASILEDRGICAFDKVEVLFNQSSSDVIEAIDAFFDERQPNDLLLLYFSGHGVRDESGSLYLAVRNTIRSRLRSTAIKSDYIREAMDESRSKRQVVILDCCNSGAFPQGTKAELGGTMGMTRALQGFGRFVLTASDSTQFAWEGDVLLGETHNSLFTHFLMKGLQGEADSDGDGAISVDELYEYAYHEIARITPKQTPTKSASRAEGEIVLRDNLRIEDMKPFPLPAALLDTIENPFTDVRLGAVQQLMKLLHGKNLGLARSAREALERIAQQDDSRLVTGLANRALESVQADRSMASPDVEEKQLPSQRLESESRPKRQADRTARESPRSEGVANAKVEARPLAEEKTAARKAAQGPAQQEHAAVSDVSPIKSSPGVAKAVSTPRARSKRNSGLNMLALAAGGVALVVMGFIGVVVMISALLPDPSSPPNLPAASVTPELTLGALPSLTAQVPVTSDSTPTPIPTRTPNLAATQQSRDLEAEVQEYFALGYLTTAQGSFVLPADFSVSLSEYTLSDEVVHSQATDFYLSAHFNWSIPAAEKNAAGCGYFFGRQEGSGDEYGVFLEPTRIYFLSSRGDKYTEVGKTRGTGRVDFRATDEAEFTLIVRGASAFVLVDGELIGEYSLSNSLPREGSLGIWAWGSNEGSVTCEMTDVHAWIAQD